MEHRHELAETGIEFKIAEMTQSDDQGLRRIAGLAWAQFFSARKLNVGPQFFRTHRRCLHPAGEGFADASKILLRQGADLRQRLLPAETKIQVFQCDTPVPRVEPVGEGSAGPANSRRGPQRQGLQRGDGESGQTVEHVFHRLTKTDFLDAVVKVLGAAEDFDFDAHEVNGQIAPVDFREAHGVFLCGDDGVRLALFAAVDDVEHFLLAEAVMVGKALGIN